MELKQKKIKKNLLAVKFVFTLCYRVWFSWMTERSEESESELRMKRRKGESDVQENESGAARRDKKFKSKNTLWKFQTNWKLRIKNWKIFRIEGIEKSSETTCKNLQLIRKNVEKRSKFNELKILKVEQSEKSAELNNLKNSQKWI